jgi:hypothetical protein
MLIATTVVLVGLLFGIGAAQLGGLRLGGVIVVPLVSVYLLRSFATFPVFVASVAAAYVSIDVIKDRVLLYGRPLFITSVLIGTLVPVLVFDVLAVAAGIEVGLTNIEFIASVLPGIAAYNYHRMDANRRVLDMVWSLVAVLFLTVVGIGLIILVGLSPLADALPVMLLSPNSDIAVAFGLAVDQPPVPVIGSDIVTVGLAAFGIALSEWLRERYGLRIGGMVVVPLIVLAAFRNMWMLPMWVCATALSYVIIQLVHRLTLLYGRVLLALSIIIGLFVATAVVTIVPVRSGQLPLLVGILAGVSGYNTHVVPPAERRASVAVTVGALVILAIVARLFVVPPAGGFLQSVSTHHLAIAAVLLLPAIGELYRLESVRPAGPNGATTAEHSHSSAGGKQS